MNVFEYLDAFFESGYSALQLGNLNFPSEHVLSFQGPGVTMQDDPTNDRTIVTIANGNTTTTTTATFVQPAALATVTVPVTSTASLAPGLAVYIAGGGYYAVSSITDGTHFVAENLGLSGNAAPTTNVTSPALVIPVGPANSLAVENNGTLLTVRSILNFLGGLVAVDNSGAGRTDIYVSPGAPVTVSGSHTLQPGETWGLIAPGSVTTMPAVPVLGLKLELMTSGSGFSTGGRATFNGNGPTMQDPQDPNNIGGSRPAAATVFGLAENTTYAWRYDGTLYRYAGDKL
jgi:hypothetical protein